MKKLIFASLVSLTLMSTACSGGGNGDKASGAAPGNESVENKGGDGQATNPANAAADKMQPQGQIENPQTPNLRTGTLPDGKQNLEQPKVKPHAETETDKLLKQYNEAFVALIPSSKSGKIDDAALKRCQDLQAQIAQLEKEGKLSETQKSLFHATSDAFSKLKK